MGLSSKCSGVEEKYGVKVPIARKLRSVAEEKMLVKRIIPALKNSRTREESCSSIEWKTSN